MKSRKKRILVADDNKSVLASLQLLLEDHFDEIVTFSNTKQIPYFTSIKPFDVYLLDMNFTRGNISGNEGLFWKDKILELDSEAVVVFITAYGDVELAVKAVKEGAFDFIIKPWDNHKLITTLNAAVNYRKSRDELKRTQKKENVLKDAAAEHFPFVKGHSKAMENVYDMLRKVAKTDANILILGENGTGKEVIARQLHNMSPRQDEIFLAVDIASMSEGLIESELFGHTKGAFTDARTDRTGKFEAASGGTLLLDEIGNLSPSIQAKLLSVIQNRKITPVGSNKNLPIDIRLICATNKNLEKMITEGTFREDLFFRINTVTINLPPLRQRKEDILPIAEYYLDQFSRKYGKPNMRLDKQAVEKLSGHSWKGNIRELKHSIEKAVILSDENILTEYDFHLTPAEHTGPMHTDLVPLDQLEKTAILHAIELHHGNMTSIAKALNITRQTLYNKIKKYDL